MNTLTKLRILQNIYKLIPACEEEYIISKLNSLVNNYDLSFYKGKVIIAEEDPLLTAMHITDTPKNTIYYNNVVLAVESERFILFHLRNGFSHYFSKVSSWHTSTYIFTENSKPPGKLKMLWYNIRYRRERIIFMEMIRMIKSN